MSNLHGEFLSIHKISQAWPGVPKTQRKVKIKGDVKKILALLGWRHCLQVSLSQKRVGESGRSQQHLNFLDFGNWFGVRMMRFRGLLERGDLALLAG
jgi:hypothetical protein